MKTLIPVLAASLFLLSGCDTVVNSWGPSDLSNGLARFSGTVEDTPLDADADLTLTSFDGDEYGYDESFDTWMDLSATTAKTDGTMGMMYVMGVTSPEALFSPGVRSITPMSEGGELDILLCGENGNEYYDEPADEIVIEVEETESGGRNVLLRGTAQGGERFQQIEFELDADLVPVRAGDPTIGYSER